MLFRHFVINNNLIYHLLRPIYRYIVVPTMYPIANKKLSKLKIKNKKDTIEELVNTNKSLSRYGDGELQWMLGNKKGSFEKNSPLLKLKLQQIIMQSDNNFMIALPDAFISVNQFNNRAKLLWKTFIVSYSKQILPFLNSKKLYYNTSSVRPYIDYRDRKYAGILFKLLKKIWYKKNILIIEGAGTRLGVGNNLFNNANNVKRIECPVNNAFEHYNKIFNAVKIFLHTHNNYLSLISLGPTATILAYDIYKNGYRAIDIGHVDLEYSWYLMKVKKPTNISYKYVNEVPHYKSPQRLINDNKYKKEIVYKIL